MSNFYDFSCKERGKFEYNNLEFKGEGRKWYQHDIDQLVYSKAFRKLQKKTQLLSERDPRCRTRLIHTLEVIRIAKEISEELGLDLELTEAIALGHDFGNTAYGRTSNDFLNSVTGGFFLHEEISGLMIAEATQKKIPLAHDYKKLCVNLLDDKSTKYGLLEINEFPYKINVYKINTNYHYNCISPEVVDGIVKHGTKKIADTLEGQVVNYADNIAYLSQDIDDLISSKIISEDDLDKFEALTEKPDSCTAKDKCIIDNAFNRSRSSRIGVYVNCFVDHNLTTFNNGKFEKYHTSEILKMNIPVLEMSKDLKYAIDTSWKYVESFYSNELIMTSNQIKESKMKTLWNILSDTNFTSNNQSYKKFMEQMKEPIYNNYRDVKNIDEDNWGKWVKAYFIAQLSCDEIDWIINSYQARDYIFELDI